MKDKLKWNEEEEHFGTNWKSEAAKPSTDRTSLLESPEVSSWESWASSKFASDHNCTMTCSSISVEMVG